MSPNQHQWPFDQELPEPLTQRDEGALSISIIMPSYNQAQYLAAAIRSVILQRYPNLEFIVLDGGSTDGSVEILHEHDRWLSSWESGTDGGQVCALNKGFAMASGEILGWLNSDDILLPNALDFVARAFVSEPESEFVVGKSLIIDEHGVPYYAVCGLPPTAGSILFWSTAGFTQPSTFWTRRAASQVGPLNSNFPLAFDAEYFLRLATKSKGRHLDAYLAGFRRHPESITERHEAVRRREDHRFRCELYGLGDYPRWYRQMRSAYYHVRYRLYAGLFRVRLLAGLEKPFDIIERRG